MTQVEALETPLFILSTAPWMPPAAHPFLPVQTGEGATQVRHSWACAGPGIHHLIDSELFAYLYNMSNNL